MTKAPPGGSRGLRVKLERGRQCAHCASRITRPGSLTRRGRLPKRIHVLDQLVLIPEPLAGDA